MPSVKKIAPEKKKKIPGKTSAVSPMAVKPVESAAPVRHIPAKISKEESEEKQKLRIKVRAYDHKILDISIKQIADTILRSGAEFLGPIPLPTEIRKYTVNRSSFVHKDAREQFEMRIHKRLIDILNPGSKIIDSLTNLNLPAGVDIEVKMI